MFFGRPGQWFGNNGNGNVHLPWCGRLGEGIQTPPGAEQSLGVPCRNGMVSPGNATGNGAAQPAAGILLRGEAGKLLSTSHTKGEQYIWYNSAASRNPVGGKFGVFFFQAFVHTFMGLSWIVLVNQVSVMEAVTSLVHPTCVQGG